MSRRLAACDTCRAAKVACDHTRPSCSRCLAGNEGDLCTYRDRPFKRRRTFTEKPQEARRNKADDETRATVLTTYPNPGYSGALSQAAIFGELPAYEGEETSNAAAASTALPKTSSNFVADETSVSRGADLLVQASSCFRWPLATKLVEVWLEQGLNLHLGGSFTRTCARTVDAVLETAHNDVSGLRKLSRRLFLGSDTPLPLHASANVVEFCASFGESCPRWETLGLFFCTVARAAEDIQCFRPLYGTTEDRRRLQKAAMSFSDRCLELSISLDCLNDLQLVLQYENFISHSNVDGDESYRSWRRLGEVVSSALALGYHDNLGSSDNTANFILVLRRMALARMYSAEINVSMFLGRPPRLRRQDIRTLLLQDCAGLSEPVNGADRDGGAPAPQHQLQFGADTRWSAKYATIKEDILAMYRHGHVQDRTAIARIWGGIDKQWHDVPQELRLENDLKLCHRTPAERDLLAAIKLQHLHVLFLLEIATAGRVSDPPASLVAASGQLFRLVVQSAVLKHHLGNSGTALVWKVVHYGLPAAGIICLSLNKHVDGSNPSPLMKELDLSQTFQDLSVFIAQVETGALVHPQHPNYALLLRAITAIKKVLSRSLNDRATSNDKLRDGEAATDIITVDSGLDTFGDWDLWSMQGSWGFEHFWPDLAGESTFDV